jgi:cell wall-associated NlpC family hydrolase
LLQARQIAPRPRPVHLLVVCGLLVTLAAISTLLPAGTRPAAASPASARQLQQRLEELNTQADQQVEDYLQARLALRRTQAANQTLQRQLGHIRRQLADARAGIGARAAVAYVHGPATEVASLLGADDPTQVLERAQLLDLLAARDSDQLSTATTIEQELDARAAEVAAVQRQHAAIVAQLAGRKAAIQRLVSQTRQTLARLLAADRQRAAATARPPARTPPTAAPTKPPAGVSGNVAAVVRYAYAQLDKPYAWGAAGPDAFDCSGLTMMAWAQAGVSLPHSSRAQFGVGRRVTRSELQPGDLIYRNSPISHVALYVGNGLQVAATHTGSTVKQQSAWDGNIVGFTRPTG